MSSASMAVQSSASASSSASAGVGIGVDLVVTRFFVTTGFFSSGLEVRGGGRAKAGASVDVSPSSSGRARRLSLASGVAIVSFNSDSQVE